MDTSDQIMYAGCWVILMLYIVTTLAVFTRQSCIGCAAAFLIACLLWLDLSLFNAWFFLPAFMRHMWEIDLHVDSAISFFRSIFTSEAARDVYLIMLGSFTSYTHTEPDYVGCLLTLIVCIVGSWLAVFNAASMLRTEGCIAMFPHEHGRLSRYLIRSVYQLCDYLDFGDKNVLTLPITTMKHIHLGITDPKGKNRFLF
ncbi:hypothetical protein GGR58DRAFT_59364 [Xylaria digitata]|nr:hypothetical protein GGR58DRAFT_59364 [Xylaria digitata]